MLRTISFCLIALITLLGSCDLFTTPEDENLPVLDTTGTIIIDFNIPIFHLTDEIADMYPFEDINHDIYRYHLNIYEGTGEETEESYLYAAGVSRFKQFYTFHPLPGKYSFEAALVCTGVPFLCDFVGFPEDNMIWSYGVFEVFLDSITRVKIEF